MSSLNSSDAPNEKIVTLNQDIGYLLLNYLDGLNVIDFMEAVNGSQQFQTVEICSDRAFNKLFRTFHSRRKIVASIRYLHLYLDTCFIDGEGYLSTMQYSRADFPALRLFIHPTFSLEALKGLCCSYKTSAFQCYTRLLPLNTQSYAGNLLLIDYFKHRDSVGCARELNDHERSILKGMTI